MLAHRLSCRRCSRPCGGRRQATPRPRGQRNPARIAPSRGISVARHRSRHAAGFSGGVMQAPLSGRHSAGARDSGKHSTANGPLPPGNLRISQDFQLSKRALKLWRDKAVRRKRMAARFFEFAAHRKSRHGCGGDRQGGKPRIASQAATAIWSAKKPID